MTALNLAQQISALEQEIARVTPVNLEASLNHHGQGICTDKSSRKTTPATHQLTQLLQQLFTLRMQQRAEQESPTSRPSHPPQVAPIPIQGPLHSEAKKVAQATAELLSRPSPLPASGHPISVEPQPGIASSSPAPRRSGAENTPPSTAPPSGHPISVEPQPGIASTGQAHRRSRAENTTPSKDRPISPDQRFENMVNVRFLKNQIVALQKELKETEESIRYLQAGRSAFVERYMYKFLTLGLGPSCDQETDAEIEKLQAKKQEIEDGILALEAILLKDASEKATSVRARALEQECLELEVNLKEKNISLDGAPLTINPHAYFTLAELNAGINGKKTVRKEIEDLVKHHTNLERALWAYQILQSLQKPKEVSLVNN